MKEIRISLLLLVSLILLLVSFVVLFIWGFAYYRQSAEPATIVVKDDLPNTTKAVDDSLQRIYTSTVNKLNIALDSTRLDVDSVQLAVDEKLKTFYALKDEINLLIATKNSNKDIANARQQLAQLQQKIDDWRRKYTDVADENKRLNFLLQQLTDNLDKPQPVVLQKEAAEARQPVPSLKKAEESSSLFVANNLQLKAMMLLDDKEQETFEALQVDEIRGVAEVKNNFSSVRGADVYVLIIQPDGSVLKQSAWNTGMFETNNGRKIYTQKLHFDYTKAELKRLNFTISTSGLKKGKYTLQLYNNGVLIGSITKSLS